MDLLLVGLLVLAVAAVVAVALGRVGGGMPAAGDPLPPPLDSPLARAEDLDRARFSLALRGYRQDQVDQVLDEARDLLAARDAEIARLQERVAAAAPTEPGAAVGTGPVPAPVAAPVSAPLAEPAAVAGPADEPAGEPVAEPSSTGGDRP